MAAALMLAALVASPAPTVAQTPGERDAFLSATLTVDEHSSGRIGCDNTTTDHADCSTALTENGFTYNGQNYWISALYIWPNGDFHILFEYPIGYQYVPLPDEFFTVRSLIVDGLELDFADYGNMTNTEFTWPDAILPQSFMWTDGQTVSVSISNLSDTFRRAYSWCFNRMSENGCNAAIARWEGETQSVAPPDSGHCPDTHQIRTATSAGRKCEQSYNPLPPGGALAEAWGVTEIAPPAETTDDWDGTERPCHQQGHGYYVLPTNRHHGLGKGCHYHNGTRQDRGNTQWSGHHEHKFVNRH